MSSQDHPSSSTESLLPGFKSIQQIRELSNSQLLSGRTYVSVIGFVKDFQAPFQCRGTDFKCTIEIKDSSVLYDTSGLKVNIFWPLNLMPEISGSGDAVLIRGAKAQMYGGTVSLLANKFSEFHVLSSRLLTAPLAEITWKPGKGKRPVWKHPTAAETKYVLSVSEDVPDMSLPSSEDFKGQVDRSINIKDKYSLLKDIKLGGFYDLIGEVVRVYDGSAAGSVTVYLSDYTANSQFYNYEWKGNGETASRAREGDEYGYIKRKTKKEDEWPGPYGKTVVQLTLYDENAEFMREGVKVGSWLLMKNVKIDGGSQGGPGCLEGKVRGDRENPGRVQVEMLIQAEESIQNDTRWIDAVRRKKDWWAKFEKQKQALLDEAAGLAVKRKADSESNVRNSKQRRKEKRAAAHESVAVSEVKDVERLDLNPNIRCSHTDVPSLRISQILKPQVYLLDPDRGEEVILPFFNSNYKANVRVVGYFPHKIQDFAVGRRVTEYDMLSDYSGGEDTDLEEDRRLFKAGKGFGQKRWEWRFALEVEDAGPKLPRDRMWLLVDNPAAQALLDMDAANLRVDTDMLQQLKERLCILWGDLEEQKFAQMPQPTPTPVNSSFGASQSISSSFAMGGEQPGLDSDEENDRLLRKPSITTQVQSPENHDMSAEATDPYHPEVKNKAFICCIRQYGIEVDEKDPDKANGRNGKRWERRFGMFGVTMS